MSRHTLRDNHPIFRKVQKYFKERGDGFYSVDEVYAFLEIKVRRGTFVSYLSHMRYRGLIDYRVVHKKPKLVIEVKYPGTKKKIDRDLNLEPSSPDRTGARVIFNAIQDRYVGMCYIEGWSDERISKSLGIPRKWVTDIREKFFGPEFPPANQEIQKILDEIKDLVSRFTDERDRLLESLEKIKKDL